MLSLINYHAPGELPPETVTHPTLAEVAGNLGILLALIIGIPLIITAVLTLFKINFTKLVRMSLYAFSCGLIMMIGTVGFISEAIHHLQESPEIITNSVGGAFTIIGVILGGCIVGVLLIFSIRWFFIIRNKKELHNNHDHHEHSDIIINFADIETSSSQSKWMGVILLLSHKSIDGLSIGLKVSESHLGQLDWGFIIAFLLHIVPLTVVVYLTQYDLYKSRKKAFLYSTALLLMGIPFVFIGGFLGHSIEHVFWLMPFLFAISGIILTVMSFIELIPEFIDNRSMDRKNWYITVAMLIFGIILAIVLLSIHHH